jgi:hypothetical protein
VIVPLFAEGITSLVLPCTWAMAIPAVLMAIAGGGRRTVAAASMGGLVVGSMVRATGTAVADGGWALVAGVGLVAAFVGVVRMRRFAQVAAFSGAAIATALWQPCVGEQLGNVLNTGVDRPLAAAVSIVPYALGVAWVVPIASLALEFPNERARRSVATAGAVVGSLIGLVVMLGWHVPAIATLARWSFRIAG